MSARAPRRSASSTNIFEKRDIHVHVPEGATPKDGPSAGVGMITSIVSALTGIAVRKEVAMTGEITLRGRVLPIGGLKEKLLAALRGGLKTVLIPKENESDLPEIPDNVKKGLEIIPVSTVDEVLARALVKPLTAIEWPNDLDGAAEAGSRARRSPRPLEVRNRTLRSPGEIRGFFVLGTICKGLFAAERTKCGIQR